MSNNYLETFKQKILHLCKKSLRYLENKLKKKNIYIKRCDKNICMRFRISQYSWYHIFSMISLNFVVYILNNFKSVSILDLTKILDLDNVNLCFFRVDTIKTIENKKKTNKV